MNGVQGLPGAMESNTENSREEAQKSQNGILVLVSFVLLRGYSVSVNSPGGWNPASQTDAVSQADKKIVCKYIKMNGLQNKQRPGRSKSVKPNQTDLVRV